MTAGRTIAAAARLWLKPRSPWMARARRELTAFSPPMVEMGLRELFADIAAHVEELERRETPPGACHSSPVTVCHVLSANLPNPGIVSIIIGLLAGARNVVKPATGDPMPALFVQSLAAVDAKLAGRVTLTNDRDAYRTAKVVVAYGDDETIEALRLNVGGASAPRPHARTRRSRGDEATPTFFGFGHRVSIGIVDLRHSAFRIPHSAIATAAARDASIWDQRGCMSPQCFYVKGGAAAFAEALAREMEAFDRRWPRGTLPFEDAAAIARARTEWSFRGRVWASRRSTHWTVVLDEHNGWAPSPLNRFVFVRPFELLPPRDSKRVIRDSVAGQRIASYESPITNQGLPPLSTVGFAGFSLKEVMGIARADRYCSLGEMQRPSLLQTNGSRPAVGELVMVDGG